MKRFIKDEKITRISFIANAGGLLGLCMGFSVISLAEILYYCLLSFFSSLKLRKDKSRQTQSEGLDDISDDELDNEGVIRLSDSELKLCQQINYEQDVSHQGGFYFHIAFKASIVINALAFKLCVTFVS